MTARPPAETRRKFTTIPGFSDQVGFPRLGKLRLGVRSSNAKGKEFPTEVDYFIFDPEPTLEAELRTRLTEQFTELYGAKPTMLPHVRFASSNRDHAFSQSLEMWGSSKMLCHGNGVEAERLTKVRPNDDQSPSAWLPHSPCANHGCPQWEQRQCSMITRLRFLLPDVSVAGYFQIDTSSKYSSANLRDAINLLEALFGQIHGIPLTLSRVPKRMEHEGTARTHYILDLRIPNVTLSQAQSLASASRIALPAAEVEEVVEDLPEDLVADAGADDEDEERENAFEAKILTGFAVMAIGEEEQEKLRHEFPVRADLYAELHRRWIALPQERRQANAN